MMVINHNINEADEYFNKLTDKLKKYFLEHPINYIRADKKERWRKYGEVKKEIDRICGKNEEDKEASVNALAYATRKLRIISENGS